MMVGGEKILLYVYEKKSMIERKEEKKILIRHLTSFFHPNPGKEKKKKESLENKNIIFPRQIGKK